MRPLTQRALQFSLAGGAVAALAVGYAIADQPESPGSKEQERDTSSPKAPTPDTPKKANEDKSYQDKAKDRAKAAAKEGFDRSKKMARSELNRMIRDWPAEPKQAVMDLMQKYGPPNEATASLVVWHDNGPWQETVVSREMYQHNFPKPHKDFVEQFVGLKVPADKFDDLAAYDGSVIAERTRGVISARCNKEEMNILALNLAHDIVEGKRDVEEARNEYASTVAKVSSGEMSEKVQELQFESGQDTGDTDQALNKQARLHR